MQIKGINSKLCWTRRAFYIHSFSRSYHNIEGTNVLSCELLYTTSNDNNNRKALRNGAQ